MNQAEKMDKIVSLCKRRGFIFPGSEIYGGMANSWDYGPLGVELKNNIKELWWKRFVRQRSDIAGIDAALIMNPKVWKSSGHLDTFNDPLVECKKCHSRYRADELQTYLKDDQSLGKMEKMMKVGLEVDNDTVFDANKDEVFWVCESCKTKNFGTTPRQFNLMFKTFIGPVDPINSLWQAYQSGSKMDDMINVLQEVHRSTAYLRPETAQAMFVQFKNVLDTTRKTLPFGIAQIGKAFRNEITPGNFVFRTREFEQMEIEYFIRESDWEKAFEEWREAMKEWMKEIGLNLDHVHELEVPKEELAHYSKRTIDFEYDFPFGTKELYGLAYRTDFDLANHQKASGQTLEYTDPHTNEKFIPHVIEPTWGVDRSFLAVLCESFDDSDPERTVLRLPAKLAPYKAAVFPLLKNKPELVAKAKGIYDDLLKKFPVAWDERGNVGKRYYSQDEIGTPFCITVDFDTLENDTVTIRDRDTAQQERVKIEEIENYINTKI